MAETICDTSPLQYLHQLNGLDWLKQLARHVLVPKAVADELQAGRVFGHDVPDVAALEWVTVVHPSIPSALRLVKDLGPGEAEALALALERPNSVLLLDDDFARRHAKALGVKFMGTLGFLVNAKQAGLVSAVGPLIEQLTALGFRTDPLTRKAVLTLAQEL